MTAPRVLVLLLVLLVVVHGDWDTTAGLVDRLLTRALPIHRLGRKSVCYGSLGCFHVTGRFAHFRRVPDPPEVTRTQLLLCTRRHPQCAALLLGDDDALDVDLPLKVLVHGYGGRWDHPRVLKAKDGILKTEDCNVVLVDWSVSAKGPSYLRAVANAELVGRQVARALESLSTRGASTRDMHVIGFSLGAQIAGFVGEDLKAKGLKLGRITGLDPASFLFERTNLDPRRKLDAGDAELVDVVHTDGSLLWADGFGSLAPLGHVDFFPNGGQHQPGCTDTYVDALAFRLDQRGNTSRSCSHGRALDIYIESLQSTECRFLAFPCPGLKDFQRSFVHGDCFSCDSGSCAEIGSSNGRGPLFLVTRDTKPYCGQQVRALVSFSPRTLSVRGDLQLLLRHGNATTAFDLNTKVYPLRRTLETLQGGRSASSVVALKSGSLSASKTPTLLARVLFKPSPGTDSLRPHFLFLDRVAVTTQEGHSWYYCGREAVVEGEVGASHGEVELQLDMQANC